MSFNEKYQAGESYGDAPKLSNDSFFGKIRNTELLIGILTSLPSTSSTRVQLTNKLIDSLWNDLQHPPLSYVGGDVSYQVVNDQAPAIDQEHNEYNTIEFEVPGTGVRLREEIPCAPNGLHHYRMPDGSFNNIMEPHLGRAGSPYAKSVRSPKKLHGVKPDAAQLFDLLMAREEDDFKENPAGISSMLFYHASIIIHDIFRTSRTDMNKSDTSSYLDLAPLYGSSLRDQLKIRTMKGGLLKPNTFHEKHLLAAGVNVMLVLYNRFHNHVCDVLLQINEGGRFTMACTDGASAEDRAKATAKQDHDLFNTARLIVCAMYASIAMGDHLRAIMNTHSTDTDWALEPRMEIGKQYDGEGVPRGVGNQVSVESNLLYRFHSSISKKDELWINDFFLKIFPGRSVEDLENITLPELGQAMFNFNRLIPVEPSHRTFADLERQDDGKFKNEDLVRILKEAMEDPAGTFGSRMVPKALKIIEIQGINQARKWGCASLNEFREFFGLKRYESFGEINSDEYIAHMLEKLYTDPDMPVRNPGSGICPTYTVGRAVLADAITLVHGDRFLTLDYTVSNLTAWGMSEVQGDPKTLRGSMLYKLIQRGLPGWFSFNSIAVMQPMYTKKANIEIAKKLGTLDQYTLDDPSPPQRPVLITSSAGIKQVLDNPQKFPSGWSKILDLVFNRKKDLSWFMLAGDEPRNYEHRQKTMQAFTAFNLKKGVHQIDLIRDVAIPLNTQLTADLFYFDLRTDENPDGTLSVAELYKSLVNLRIWATNNLDPAESWNRRRRSAEGAKVLVDALPAQGNSPDNVVDQLWLLAFGEIGVLVTTFYEVMDFFLRPENGSIWAEVQDLAQKGDAGRLQGYVAEAQRFTSEFRIVRYPASSTQVDSKPVQPGNVVILNIAEAARDLAVVSNADNFDPQRKQPGISAYSYGHHECCGRAIALAFITGLVKISAGPKNLRSAPGQMGVVKSIKVGQEKIYLNDSWSYFAFNVSTWKVHFDGLGKGNFQGNNDDANGGIEMQQYYAMLKKRKAESLN
ncbi:Cytochrome P450 [Penicillium samsonianum]|uniref:Cytochrome P450 n=1 Tax=Penicillium samsonianum TaxID=1882272 RepID=UPI002548B8CA|nr:Cytochrome P450 [Penicillium samsonianum]KAJ6137471.1 Cytochrome P450 [Penicillium samsonianum]